MKKLPLIRYKTNPELKGNRISGIYFLFKDSVLLYIGQSMDLQVRIANYKSGLFDEFSFVKCSEYALDYYEYRWIQFFNPPMNIIRKKFTLNE